MLKHLNQYYSMASTSKIAISRMSTYHSQKSNTPHANTGNVRISTFPNYHDSSAKLNCWACVGCSSNQHSDPRTRYHLQKCSAWGQTYSNCKKPNHLLRVCQVVIKSLGTNEATIYTLVTHITFNQITGTDQAQPIP